jgi:hypothetical protein
MATKKKGYKIGEYEYDVPTNNETLKLLYAVPKGKSKPTKKEKKYNEETFLNHMSDLIE